MRKWHFKYDNILVILGLVFVLISLKLIFSPYSKYGEFVMSEIIFDICVIILLCVILYFEDRKAIRFERLALTVFDNVPYPIYFKDCKGKYTECNNAFLILSKKSKENIIGKTVYEVFEGGELEEWKKTEDDDLIKNPGLQVTELHVKSLNGSYKDYIIKKDTIYSDRNKIVGIVGIIIDITEVKKTSSELVAKIKQENNKNDFFSNISHEIRTPINVMLSALKIMEDGKTYDEKYFKMVKENGNRLLKLVNNLIDVSKIEAGYCKLNIANYNIVNVVEEIVMSVAEYIKSNEIELVFDTDIEEKIIACDAEKMERIVLNLLSNAVKFTPKGGKIEVNVKDEGESILISTSDTGIGIEREKIESIFERFIQVNNAETMKKEGSGIGLSLVKSLVEMHDGNIWAESEKGVGTTIYVRLPNVKLEGKEESRLETDMRNVNIEFSNIHK